MSEIKALKSLRGYADVNWDPWPEARSHLRALIDAIEAEIAERFMELPVDADGEPIRIGDTVESFDCPRQDYARFIVEGYTSEFPNGEGKLLVVGGDDDGQWYSDTVRHFKPRTVEDVLREFADRYLDYEGVPSAGRRGVGEALMGEYADELRELIGGAE